MSSDDKEIAMIRKGLSEGHIVLHEISIEDLSFCANTYNCLVSAGIKNVEDLALMSDAEIAGLQEVTPTDLNKIKRLRFALGVSTETPRLEGFELLDALMNHRSKHSRAGKLSSSKRRVCPQCGREADHCSEYDSYYCEVCDIWLDPVCGDPNCMFCAHRPEKPSQIENDNDYERIIRSILK
jgi:hypothetical protein